MVLTAFATILHCKDMKESHNSKYFEQLYKQKADMTCMCNHFVALAGSYDGFLSWEHSRRGRDNIQEGIKKPGKCF